MQAHMYCLLGSYMPQARPALPLSLLMSATVDRMNHSPTDIGAISSGNLHQIFSYLEPKDLCYVSATCKHWRVLSQDQASSKQWKFFYKQRWMPTMKQNASTRCWQTEYGSKMKRVNSWHHKHYQHDLLYGHSSAVQCLGIIPGCHLVATGSSDRTVKIWDMQAGTTLASSRLHGGPVRCLAADQRLLVSGSSDHKLRVWLGTKSKAGFDLTDPIKLSRTGHTGPIAAVALDNECIYSGSWDYTMRVWQRSSLQLAAVVPFDDWVFSLASRGGHVLAGLSSRFHILDQSTLQPLKCLRHQAGGVLCLEGSQDGRMAYSGGHDGRVLAHDIRLPDACSVVATLWEISSSFKSLSLEDPWLAAALSDGSVAMHHTEMASKHAKHRQGVRLGTKANSRLFQMPQGATCCVDLSDQRLVAGSDSGIVSSWDFSRAEQKAEEVQAAKAARGRARQHRAEKHSSRVAQQREKAALALAALQARHPDAKGSAAASTDGGTPEPAVSGAVHSQAAAHAAEQTTATLPTAEECSVSNSTCDGVQESCQQQEDTHGIQGRGLIELAHVHSLPMLVSGCTPCSVSEADSAGKPTQNYPCAVSEARPIPLRRYASAAGAPHLARTVPSPLLPNCISDCRQNSPNSMASWQIVRPRPVQRDRSSFKASAHVHAQA